MERPGAGAPTGLQNPGAGAARRLEGSTPSPLRPRRAEPRDGRVRVRTRVAAPREARSSVVSMTRGNEPGDVASDREAAGDGRDELVVRVREELEAARRRVREAWA